MAGSFKELRKLTSVYIGIMKVVTFFFLGGNLKQINNFYKMWLQFCSERFAGLLPPFPTLSLIHI